MTIKIFPVGTVVTNRQGKTYNITKAEYGWRTLQHDSEVIKCTIGMMRLALYVGKFIIK